MSVTVFLFHSYTNTVSTMVELRMARLNSLIRGLLGRLWRERKKPGVPYSSAQTHSKLSSPFPLTGFLGTLLKAGTFESGKVLSYWDPRWNLCFFFPLIDVGQSHQEISLQKLRFVIKILKMIVCVVKSIELFLQPFNCRNLQNGCWKWKYCGVMLRIGHQQKVGFWPPAYCDVNLRCLCNRC